MKSPIDSLLHGLQRFLFVLKIDSLLYRNARLLCQWLEVISPAVSQRAGFVYDLAWMSELDDYEATEPLK